MTNRKKEGTCTGQFTLSSLSLPSELLLLPPGSNRTHAYCFFYVNLCIHSSCLVCAHKKVYFSLQIIHVRQTNPSVTETVEKKKLSNCKRHFCMNLPWGFALYYCGKNILINCFIKVFVLNTFSPVCPTALELFSCFPRRNRHMDFL